MAANLSLGDISLGNLPNIMMSSSDTPRKRQQSGIHRGKLFKMMESVIKGDGRHKWTHVLRYIDSHTYTDHEKGETLNLAFDSPLPAFCLPTKELEQELAPCSKSGDSLLRRAVLAGAPVRIVACFCHLAPKAISALDHKGRILLHLAARVPVSDNSQQILKILVAAYPKGLVITDTNGRTPLHWLLWYHCTERSPEVVNAFCQPLDKNFFFEMTKSKDLIVRDPNFALPAIPRPHDKIPHVAAIIPDAVFGCLPLHYAVANGASDEIIYILLQAYPLSKHVNDRYGRTAAHWLLGAGQVSFHQSDDAETQSKVLHISGESQNPHSTPWYSKPVKQERLQMVLTSRVARSMDGMGRNPLHWACFTTAHAIFHSDELKKEDNNLRDKDEVDSTKRPSSALVVEEYLPFLQQLVDAHTNQILGKDKEEQTPLMVLLDTMSQLQQSQDLSSIKANPVYGGFEDPHIVTSWVGFELNQALLKMLMHHPDSTSYTTDSKSSDKPDKPQKFPVAMEDSKGRLPLHMAVFLGCGVQTISTLIRAHPTGLVHTTESYQSPLHMALCNSKVAPYATAQSIELLLRSYHTGAHGSVMVDGRMALKMEDAHGVYPVHYATQNNASLRVLDSLLNAYPPIAHLIRHDTQDLAFFHLIPGHLSTHEEDANLMKDLLRPESTESDYERRKRLGDALPVIRQKMQLFLPLILHQIEASKTGILERTDSVHHMHILHVAILFQALNYDEVLNLLKLCPDSARHICNCLQETLSEDKEKESKTASTPEWTVLDLHEAAKTLWHRSEEEWHEIRQLLFAHYPEVESHRHRQELLTQCVKIVLQEVMYRPRASADEYRAEDDLTVRSSVHWHRATEADEKTQSHPQLEISHSLSAAESCVRETLKIAKPPAPANAQPQRPPGTKRRNTKARKAKKMKSLPPIGELGENEEGHKDHALSGKSKYDDDDLGYEVQSEDDFDDSVSEDSYSSDNETFSDEDVYDDENESYDSDDGETDIVESEAGFSESYTDTSAWTDRDHGDDYSLSTNPTHTFSSGAGSPNSLNTKSRLARKFGNPHEEPVEADAFDRALDDPNVEEKKEDNGERKSNSRASRRRKFVVEQEQFPERPSYMSEVGMRIWTFFSLYCDVNNPNDNYVEQLAAIFGEIPYCKVEQLVQLHLPPHATDYLSDDEIFSFDGKIQRFRDVASPKCRELIHRTCYFVGAYELGTPLDKMEGNETKLIYCRPWDQHVFQVEALEWKFTTEEATEAAKTPGLSEEEIWQTGLAPAEMGAMFRAQKKPVYITFTTVCAEYEAEITCQQQLRNHQSPVYSLLASFNAKNHERQIDRYYRTDIHDVRFKKLSVGRRRVFDLESFPYAIVHNTAESLHQVLSTFGCLESTAEMKEIARDVCGALQSIHKSGVIHGNLCQKNIVREPHCKEWTIRDFKYACIYGESQYLGRISSDGTPLFSTGTLPPEMFVQLSVVELKAVERYWISVEKTYGIKIERSAIEPYVDPETGDVFVVRCHYERPKGSTEPLPELPYELVPASTATDYWAIGLVIFELCCGRPLFSTDGLTGRLLDFKTHSDWNSKQSASMIYTHVQDSIDQDLFLQMLSPLSKRSQLTMEKILAHPFFRDQSAATSNFVKTMVETRRKDSIAHSRVMQKKLHENSEKKWLDERTVRLDCFDLAILARFQDSPSQVLKQTMSRRNGDATKFPTSSIVLPYRVAMTQGNAQVTQQAVRTGKAVLHLLNTCFFAISLEKAITKIAENKGKNSIMSLSDLLGQVDLPHNDFQEEFQLCTDLASRHVETFREEPRFLIHKLIIRSVDHFLKVYAPAAEAYFYLVDEFNFVPLPEGCWVIKGANRDELLRRSILSSYFAFACAWTTSGDLSSFTRLLFAGSSETKVPQDWEVLIQKLQKSKPDNSRILSEISVLQDALSVMGKTRHTLGDHDLKYLREFMNAVDPKRRLGEMMRVMVTSDIGMWTTSHQARELKTRCKSFTMTDAISKYQYLE